MRRRAKDSLLHRRAIKRDHSLQHLKDRVRHGTSALIRARPPSIASAPSPRHRDSCGRHNRDRRNRECHGYFLRFPINQPFADN
jgi:hypothetical protein